MKGTRKLSLLHGGRRIGLRLAQHVKQLIQRVGVVVVDYDHRSVIRIVRAGYVVYLIRRHLQTTGTL